MDPITDMFNRICNAQAVLHTTVVIPFSKLKYEIAQILEKEGFIEKVEKPKVRITPRSKRKEFKINLKYNNKIPVISGIKRISKSGQRIYIKAKDLKPIRDGYGISIISTSKGLMTGKEAKKKKLGGEVLAEIW
jgi:small subunit ribosomal protein S8